VTGVDKPVRGKTEGTKKAIDRLSKERAVVPKDCSTGKWTIISVLARAADEPEFMSRLADDPHVALNEYYTLTQEEKAALASGDIQKIETWVGKLDKRLSTWLLYRLSREK
jgi:hypothetical protein